MPHFNALRLCFTDVHLKFESDRAFVAGVYEAVKGFYVDGLPRHMHNNAHALSVFHRMEYRELLQLPAMQLQDILRYKHIIVTDLGHKACSFDAEGLRSLSPNLCRQMTIHGMYFWYTPIYSIYTCHYRSLFPGE
jgi:hypothetical protein